MATINSIKEPLIISARELNKPSKRMTQFLLEDEDIVT